MSDLMREALPIVVMYVFVLALAPFIAVTMWVAFDGDRLREADLEVEPVEAKVTEHPVQLDARGALGAA